MNILNLNLPRCHFHTLIELANSGHTVYSNYRDTNEYESSLGINPLSKKENNKLFELSYFEHDSMTKEQELQFKKEKRMTTITFIEELINKYNIDILQVCIPELGYLHTYFKDKIKYIGPTEESSRLETDKLYAKDIAKQLGIKVPNIIKHGKYKDEDYCKDLSFPCVEKTSHLWNPAIVINNKEDIAVLKRLVKNQHWPRNINADYYIEEYLHDIIETNLFFVISNGEYAITHTQVIRGEGLNKTVMPQVWYFDTSIQPLSPSVDAVVRQEAGKYLEHIAKMGGSWEGSFCGAYTSKGEWNFLEINVRPDIFNSTPTFMTGDEYLKGMFEDVTLFEKAWENKICDKHLITTDDCKNEYPIHLHDKYNVAYPNNLVITDNKYYISNYGVSHLSDRGTVVADHNIPKQFLKEVEETTVWKFNRDPLEWSAAA